MNIEIKITTQVYENYSESKHNPIWKAKGKMIFTLNVDEGYFYNDKEAVEVIKKMVNSYSNTHTKYEYAYYEMAFFNPIKMDSEIFEKLIERTTN